MHISFIVIGRNESIKIFNCINSIQNFIKTNKIIKYDIIYVDSDSYDNSIDLAKKFSNVKIIKLTGQVNAAIGRNIGARYALGSYLFFIDGDMEIIENFYTNVFDVNGNLKYDFVSGEFMSYNYVNNELISIEPYHKINQDIEEVTTGGIFIIKKKLWNQLNGMNEKYRRCQDLDFGLRMSKLGHKLIRKKNIIANHHTISYYEQNRLWRDLFNCNQLYQKSVLYKDHIFNSYIYKFLFREISLFSIFASIFFVFYTGNILLLLLFPFFVLIKTFYKYKNGVSKNLFVNYTYYFLLDIFVFFGFFLFWPNSKKKYNIILINF